MKLRLWIKYLIYITLILTLIFISQHYLEIARKEASVTFRYNLYYNYSLNLLCYGGIGVLLGLGNLIREIKRSGAWKINFAKLVLLGLPSLYFSLAVFIYYSDTPFIQNILAYPLQVLPMNNFNYIGIFQVILGYVIPTSFYKIGINNSNNILFI